MTLHELRAEAERVIAAGLSFIQIKVPCTRSRRTNTRRLWRGGPTARIIGEIDTLPGGKSLCLAEVRAVDVVACLDKVGG